MSSQTSRLYHPLTTPNTNQSKEKMHLLQALFRQNYYVLHCMDISPKIPEKKLWEAWGMQKEFHWIFLKFIWMTWLEWSFFFSYVKKQHKNLVSI